MRNNRTPLSCLLLFVVLLTSCVKDTCDLDARSGRKYFVSATSLGTYTKAQLQAAATKVGFGNFAPLATYDVDFYKLIYKTHYKGALIEVSGLLAIPINVSGTPSLLSAQHGTIFRAAEAP